MTIERLEELTHGYLQQMKARVDNNLLDKESKDLTLEHERIKREFINILPSVLEKYSEHFEFNSMHEEMNLSSEDTVQKIYERIVTIKRELEEGKEISKVKQRENQQEPQQENFRRQSIIKDTLQETFQRVEQEMRRREFNIDWDSLRVYCNRIISHYTETTEQNVFKKNENDMVREEVERYIQEMEQELNNEKSEDMRLEFKDGPVCPVVTDTDEFARKNKQIADEIQEQEENSQNSPTRNENNLGGLEPIL